MWFDDYKTATADDLRAQIAQKDQEAARAAGMHFNKIFGEMGCILIDEEAKMFTVFADTSSSLFGEQRQVRSIEDVLDLRPDLISFRQVKDIEIDIQEMSHEEKRTVDGKSVSFDPPRYTYSYTFTLRMELDHPYIHRAYFPLNREAVRIKTDRRRVWTDPGRRLAAHLLNMPGLITENVAEIYDNHSLLDALYRSPYQWPDMSFGFRVTPANRNGLRQYQYYLLMAEEIRSAILSGEAADCP